MINRFTCFLSCSLLFPFALDGKTVQTNSANSGVCGTAIVSQTDPQAISGTYKIRDHHSDQTGDIVTFFVRDDIFASSPNYIEVEFVMKYGSDKLSIYAETDEWDNETIDDYGVQAIEVTFLKSTPANPERGALEIEEEYFGDFPDVDNNEKIFVLIMDINDGENQPGETYIAGYFDPSDQSGNSGNHAEILFLDCAHEQFISNDYMAVLATAVHELQHLIHHNYDSNEEIWLNEGLSEYAPRLCGYPQRPFGTYLSNPRKSLTAWDGEIEDYSRVALFVTYLANQFGEAILSELVQHSDNGMPSISNATGIMETEIFHNWILANFLNEPEGIWGYSGEEIPSLSPNIVHSNFPVESTISVKNWSAQYIRLKDGHDLSLTANGSTELIIVYDGIVQDFSVANGFEFLDPAFGVEYDDFYMISWYAGNYQSRSFTYNAEALGGTKEIVVSYNDGESEFLVGLSGGIAAVYFQNPDPEAILDKIKIFCGDNTDAVLSIKETLNSQSYLSESIQPNASAWKEIEIDGDSVKSSSFFITISSTNNSLGYDDSLSGAGLSYLNGNDLADYQVDLNGQTTSLTGNWMIDAVFYAPIGPKLDVNTTELNFYDWLNKLELLIKNSGTDILHWRIEKKADWIQLSDSVGFSVLETDTVYASLERLKLTRDSIEILTILSDQDTVTVYINVEYVSPNKLIIFPPFPNPFSPRIGEMIIFPVQFPTLDPYSASIYNLLGQTVRNWTGTPYETGILTIQFDGFSNSGNSLPSGIYFSQIRQNKESSSQKLLIFQ